MTTTGLASQAGKLTMTYDLVVRGGTVIDGSGGEPVVADVGIRGDRIAAVGGGLAAGREKIDGA